MTRRAPSSRTAGTAIRAALLGCVLLLAGCAPQTGASSGAGFPTDTRMTSETAIATDATPTGEPGYGIAVASSLGPVVASTFDPRLSPACAAPAVHTLPERLLVRGRERLVLTHAPGPPGSEPRDLVIAFHGRTNDAAQARRYFRLDEALPEAIIAYPQALRANPNAFAWGDPGDPADALRDFALVDAIVDTFGRARCIDLGRVFVVGHSLGAYFANDVACALGDRVRAVASVAGGLQGTTCVAGTAALLLHHPDDPLVPLGAGERARDAFRLANGVAEAPASPAAHPALAPLRCVRYGDDDAPHPVVWCAHDDAISPGGRYDPHTWPAGAAAAVAAFFRQLP